MTRIRGRALLASAALLALGGTSAQAQSLPDEFFSVNANSVTQLSPVVPAGKLDSPLGEELQRIKDAKIEAVRTGVLWNTFEGGAPVPDPDEPDGLMHPVDPVVQARLDNWVGALAEKGLTWRPIFLNSPSWNRLLPGQWADPDVNPLADSSPTPPPWEMAPLEPGLARGAVRALFRRYGKGGTFWGTGSDAYAIRSVEAWNEPNFAKSCAYGYRFQPGPYARFLRAVAEGAHDIDPNAEVIVGGLVDHARTTKCGISVRDYLTVVDATDRALNPLGPPVTAMVGTVGLHAYNDSPDGIMASVGMAREQIDATAFAGAGIDLNEFNDNPNDGDRIVAERRAVLTDIATRTAAASGPLCNMRSIAPYGWRVGNTEYDMYPERDAYTNGITAAVAGNASCPWTAPAPPKTEEQVDELVPRLKLPAS